ncbi:MAG: isoleucine--tRNA ligase [Sumerlaeia bacterium]
MTTQETTAPDYKKTVLTPKTDFPQRAGLAQKEPTILDEWQAMGLSEKIAARRAGAPDYVLHDGPPYANGDIHIGHALNKVLKDFVVRYKTMAGFKTDYVPGWDCHGLPIEQKVLDRLRKKKQLEGKEPLEIRRLCAEEARQWVGTQRTQFQRLGIGGDWEHPYITMDPEYEVAILQGFAELVGKGYIYKGFKPVHWDTVYETALAEAELEYNDNHVSPQIYLRFPLYAEDVPEELKGLPKPTIVIWTTTPWTMPANMGVSLSREFDYVMYRRGDEETLLIAEGLLTAFKLTTGLEDGEVVGRFNAEILDRKRAHHPVFPEKPSLLMLGEHVTLEQGTGCVHTAPAHGVEDFEIGKEYGLEVFNPVDGAGRYTALYPEMQGVSVFDANKRLIEKFRAEGTLIWTGTYEHSYAYSWRSKQPVIMRATEQWFMAVEKDGLREKALAEVDKVEWIPKWGRDRIYNMVAGRPDWCLSRQRAWGVPIPSLFDTKTGESVLSREIVEKFVSYVATEGTDCWFTRPAEDFVPDTMEKEPGRYTKESNVLDVWFDSGASHLGVLDARANLRWPADLYLEGSDQHRGWFQSSLWVAMGVKGTAPYKAVLTHGFILAEKGVKMSKSVGNVVAPLKVIEQSGADVLRLWVASEDYRGDLTVSDNILKQVSEVYRRVRNTIRFLLGNLDDYRIGEHPDAEAESATFLEDDRWILARTNELVRKATAAYDAYEFHRVYHLVNAFCVNDLSGVYLDCAKDRMYCGAPDDPARRACQATIHAIASRLLKIIAPLLPFTAHEAWDYLPKPAGGEALESVHLADFPRPFEAWDHESEKLLADWRRLLELRSEVQKAIEPLRRDKTIGNSLEARVTLATKNQETLAFLAGVSHLLPRVFIVSQVDVKAEESGDTNEALESAGLKLSIRIDHAEGAKCERCWTWTPEVGSDHEHPSLCPRCASVVRSIAE